SRAYPKPGRRIAGRPPTSADRRGTGGRTVRGGRTVDFIAIADSRAYGLPARRSADRNTERHLNTLPGFPVLPHSLATHAILVQRQAIRIVSLVLLRMIVPFSAFGASERN